MDIVQELYKYYVEYLKKLFMSTFFPVKMIV